MSAAIRQIDHGLKRSPTPLGRSSLPVLDRWAELGLMTGDLGFLADPDLDAPFSLGPQASLILSPALLRNNAGGAVLIRHGIELHRWRGAFGGEASPERQLARGLLALRCAALYFNALPADQREAAALVLPEHLTTAYRTLAGDDWSDLRAALGGDPAIIDLIMDLEPASADDRRAMLFDPATRAAAFNIYASLAPLAAPVEVSLATGGDPRIAIDSKTGCNGYGSVNRPVPGVYSFSSSTASTISTGAYGACEALRIRLMTVGVEGGYAATAAKALAEVRSDLADALGLESLPGSEVILTASGTDTELVALSLATAGHVEPLISIVVAPDETGSGIPLAAAGRHFLARTALGGSVGAGEPLAGFDAREVRTTAIHIRDEAGRPRPLSLVDRDVEAEIDRAIAAGQRVLLNVLDSSKTGHGAPSVGLVKRLALRHGSRLAVLIDCCQMRLSAAALRGYLAAGFLVQITGSKFFGGPPFSGALLVPPAIAARAARGIWLPPGLAAYCARPEWPSTFAATSRSLTDAINLGLLFRWTAALHEIGRARALDADDCEATLADLDQEITRLIAGSDRLSLVDAEPLDRSALGIFDGWAEFRTIFPVGLRRDGPSGERIAVGVDDAKRIHRWLNQPLGSLLPETASMDDRMAASAICLVGQPVKIAGQDGALGALRLCVDARLLARIVAPDGIGAREQRMAAVIADLRIVLRKLDLILRHFEQLRLVA